MNKNMSSPLLTLEGFLMYWQGQRRLTRKVIEAFPEDKLYTFTNAEPMRPFGLMAGEIHMVSQMTLDGLLTGEWKEPDWTQSPKTKTELLAAWDALNARIDTEYPNITAEAFTKEHELPWGKMLGVIAAMYNTDNELHHRGQGYVYLRALDIEPPFFWER